jgi:hypothetical protein
MKRSRKPAIVAGAIRALAAQDRYQLDRQPAAPRRLQADRVKVMPAGRALPASFLAQPVVAESAAAACADEGGCSALLVDLTADGTDEVVIVRGHVGEVYAVDAGGAWKHVAEISQACVGQPDGLAAGRFTVVAPAFQDLEVDGRRLRVIPKQDCLARPAVAAP